MKSELRCVVCNGALGGRQRRFCSRSCKNRDTNARHQSYASRQARGMRRRCRLIMDAGGRCARCGYRRNLAALTWHHIEAAKKSFNLDAHALSNRSRAEILSEVAKCILLCANCHAEERFPELALTAMSLHNIGGRKRGR